MTTWTNVRSGIRNWQHHLYESDHTKFADAVEAAFAEIGFDHSYIEQISNIKPSRNGKGIKDNIWGMIEFEPEYIWIVDCPLFQRLRDVRQTGFSFLTYPTANHSRFEHSLGVYAVVTKMLASIASASEPDRWKKPRTVDPYTENDEQSSFARKALKSAALLHDIGHGPFSHVSEKAFHSKKVELREIKFIGGISVRQFLDDFSEKTDLNINADKGLSEILSCALILSPLFQKYLGTGWGKDANEINDYLYAICCLILGEPYQPEDLASPSIISGLIDADKIDYIQRDAVICGISTGIDTHRLFFRLAVFRETAGTVFNMENHRPNNNQKEEGQPKLGLPPDLAQDQEIDVLVVDSSGSDAVREVVYARQSLHQRIYQHPLTRRAEMVFISVVNTACSYRSKGKDVPELLTDFMQMWSAGEAETFRRAGMHDTTKAYVDVLRSRRFLKRSAVISPSATLKTAPLLLDEYIRDAKSELMGKFFREPKAFMEKEQSKIVARTYENIIDAKEILENSALKNLLPENPPGKPAILPRPNLESSGGDTVFLKTGNKIRATSHVFASYQHAGDLMDDHLVPAQVSFLLASQEWRELSAIAFGKALVDTIVRTNKREYKICISNVNVAGIDDAATIEYLPTVDIYDSVFRAGGNTVKVEEFICELANNGYFDTAPRLIQVKPNLVECDEIVKTCSKYEGDLEWCVSNDSISKFLSQIPPRLRPKICEFLKKIIVLKDERIGDNILQIYNELRSQTKKNLHLVPLTLTVGKVVKQYFRGKIDEGYRHTSLAQALNKASEDEGILVFDDNIASGTQAIQQLRRWIGQEPERDGFESKLDDKKIKKFKTIPIAFAFAAGIKYGQDELYKAIISQGFVPAADTPVIFKEPIDSTASEVLEDGTDEAADLLAFLKRIGTHLMQRRWGEDAQNHALGYGNARGGTITENNVPSSTITALWCPGTYYPTEEQEADDNIRPQPWVPLFIRKNRLAAGGETLMLP